MANVDFNVSTKTAKRSQKGPAAAKASTVIPLRPSIDDFRAYQGRVQDVLFEACATLYFMADAHEAMQAAEINSIPSQYAGWGTRCILENLARKLEAVSEMDSHDAANQED